MRSAPAAALRDIVLVSCERIRAKQVLLHIGHEYTHAGAGHDTSPFPRLVLSCIDADRNEKWRIFQHFSKSTRIYIFSWKIFEKSSKFNEFTEIFRKVRRFFWKSQKFQQKFHNFLEKMRKSCRSRKTLKNAPSLAIGGANFAKIWLRFWQNFDKFANILIT